jgi:outer membrane lipoprotein-sorting protein
MKTTPMIFFFFLFLAKDINALSATEIVKKTDELIRGDTRIVTIEMTIKTQRWTRTMQIKSYENRLEKKSFVEILAPKKDMGNQFLLTDKNMWQYVPKLQQTIKISASMMLESWMGSDFNNDDIVKESSIVNDYEHAIVGNEMIDSEECSKIDLVPKKDAAVVWGKITIYVKNKDYLPIREEYYNEQNKLQKVLTCGNFKKMGNRIIPTTYQMQTMNKKEQYTLMEIKNAEFNVPIDSKLFSLQNLTRK